MEKGGERTADNAEVADEKRQLEKPEWAGIDGHGKGAEAGGRRRAVELPGNCVPKWSLGTRGNEGEG